VRAILAAVVRHPDLVPAQHQDGSDQDGGVEHLLSGARERRLQRAREKREERSANDADSDPTGEPRGSPGDALCGGEDDADDQSRFEASRKTMIRLASIRCYSRPVGSMALIVPVAESG
jgi:hypothetical protein